MTAPPAAEALTLSATLFHADIDSWLPANFGVTRPEKDKTAEWESALRGAQRDRLGLGHPDLEDAGARARAASGRAGIEALRRMQKKRKDGDGEGDVAGKVGGGGRREEDEEEDESRTRAVSKKKKSTVDVFGKKSKNASANAVHPLLRLVNPIPGYDPASAGEVDGKSNEAKDVNAEAAKPETETKLESKSETKPAESKTDSAAGTKRPRDDADADADADAEAEAEGEVDTAGMSKTQARREKRKRAKARKAAA